MLIAYLKEKTLERLKREKGSVYELEALRHAKVEKEEFTALQRSIIALEERLLSTNGLSTIERTDEETGGQRSHFLDALYASFEDRFRGTRQDIMKKFEAYLPYIKRVAVEIPNPQILDLGCGRGEWLELLRKNQYVARGVDRNRVFVNFCKELGLDVSQSDVLQYLRSLKTNSYGIITGFHIAEHLSLTTLIELLDESIRVLKRGGMMIV